MSFFKAIERPWRVFAVPEGMLDTLQVASPVTPILRLPNEILDAIFKEIDAIDQLALAMSCKRLLSASTGVSLKSSAWIYGMESWKRRTILQQLPSSNPNAWKFCMLLCGTYRPTREEYWRPKVGLDKWAVFKAYDTEMMLRKIRLWKQMPLATFCPECTWKAAWGAILNNRALETNANCPECAYLESRMESGFEP